MVGRDQKKAAHLHLALILGSPASLEGCPFPFRGGREAAGTLSIPPWGCPSTHPTATALGLHLRPPWGPLMAPMRPHLPPAGTQRAPRWPTTRKPGYPGTCGEKNPWTTGRGALLSHPKPPHCGHLGAENLLPHLQDAHDGSGVLHLHAVLPVTDVVRGLVHMDAAGEEQSLRLHLGSGSSPRVHPPTLGTYQPSSVPNHMEL